MRTGKPIVLELDQHGDPVMPTSKSALEELAKSARKDPRYSRLLAKAVVASALLMGCASTPSSTDPHALSACTIEGDNDQYGTPVPAMCEEACVGVTLKESRSGTVCHSDAVNAVPTIAGLPCYANVTGPNGELGCCMTESSAQDHRLDNGHIGFEFYACDP